MEMQPTVINFFDQDGDCREEELLYFSTDEDMKVGFEKGNQILWPKAEISEKYSQLWLIICCQFIKILEIMTIKIVLKVVDLHSVS